MTFRYQDVQSIGRAKKYTFKLDGSIEWVQSVQLPNCWTYHIIQRDGRFFIPEENQTPGPLRFQSEGDAIEAGLAYLKWLDTGCRDITTPTDTVLK